MTLATMQWHERITLNYSPADYRRTSLIRLVLPHVMGKRVLDMRTLTGHLAVELMEKGFDVSALDGYGKAVETTNELGKSRGISKGIAQEWDLTGLTDRFGENEFDTVLALDVLNHVDDPDQTMKEISAVTKSGGKLILLVPAFKSLLCARDRYYAHLHRFDKKELIQSVNRHGFEIESIRYWNFLALAPYILIEKILRRKISDGLRYRKSTGLDAFANKILRWWYMTVENNVRLPFGLSLFVIGRKNGQVRSNA